MSKIEKQWISIEELSEYLGISAVTIRFWIRSGKDIPAVRIGRQWRFRISDIDEWIKSGKAISVEMNGWMLVCCRSPHVGTPQRRMVTSSVGSFSYENPMVNPNFLIKSYCK